MCVFDKVLGIATSPWYTQVGDDKQDVAVFRALTTRLVKQLKPVILCNAERLMASEKKADQVLLLNASIRVHMSACRKLA